MFVTLPSSVPFCPLTTPLVYIFLLTLHPSPSLFQWQKQVGLIPYPLRRRPQWLQGQDQWNAVTHQQSIWLCTLQLHLLLLLKRQRIRKKDNRPDLSEEDTPIQPDLRKRPPENNFPPLMPIGKYAASGTLPSLGYARVPTLPPIDPWWVNIHWGIIERQLLHLPNSLAFIVMPTYHSTTPPIITPSHRGSKLVTHSLIRNYSSCVWSRKLIVSVLVFMYRPVKYNNKNRTVQSLHLKPTTMKWQMGLMWKFVVCVTGMTLLD